MTDKNSSNDITRKSEGGHEKIDSFIKRLEDSTKCAEDNHKKTEEIVSAMNALLAKTAEHQAKADNEALRANQAKVMVEEHSNTVAKLKGAIEADAAAISTRKSELEKISQSLANLYASCDADVSSISGKRKTAEDAVRILSEISGKASATQANIDEAKNNMDALAQKVKDGAKSVDVDLSKISSSKAICDGILVELQKIIASSNEMHERTKTTQAAIASHEKESKVRLESMGVLNKTAQEMDEKVSAYEATLSKLESSYNDLNEKVERLLPGATSAGLASSFCTQKKRFKGPQKGWVISFILCMGALLAIAAWGSAGLTESAESWDAILRHIVQRLPYVIPLVWLGIYSGRQYMLSIRMEEEYAFKEAISTVFEGYKREMGTIPANGNDVPLNTLCSNVLALLSRRPGLIYEGKHYDITPFTPALDAAEKIIPVIAQTTGKGAKNT